MSFRSFQLVGYFRWSFVRWASAACVIGAWAIGLALLWGLLLQHTYRPSATLQPTIDWPADSRLSAPAMVPRVVVFAHPFCPCTSATLHELDRLVFRIPEETSVTVVFNTCGLETAAVEASPTVKLARKIENVATVFDPDGRETRAYGASISGEVFAFDRSAKRIFHGGITVGRGHEGGSIGAKRLFQLLNGKKSDSYSGPVYGCALPVPKNGTGQ